MKSIPCLTLLGLFLNLSAIAQTTGPAQTEYQTYGSKQVSEMVDLFTGDFNYKIPLFDLPGPHGNYPFVLSYNSGVRMSDEASWVGLGWTLNPGAITRDMRGIPDDFNGVNLQHKMDKMPNINYGIGGTVNVELLGADANMIGIDLNSGITFSFNNYKGFGIARDIGVGFKANKSLGDELNSSAGIDVGLTVDNLEQSSLSLSAGLKLNQNSFRASTTINGREGMTGLNLNFGKAVGGFNHTFLAKKTYVPFPGPEMKGWNVTLDVKGGGQVYILDIYGGGKGFYSISELANTNLKSTKAYGYLYHHLKTDDAILDFNREKEGILRDETPNLAIPALTHDLFTVTGDGVGGTFRAYRNDLPIVHDPITKSQILGFGVGIEIGAGNLVKVGGNGSVNVTDSKFGKWNNSLTAINTIDDPTNMTERVYFKFIDEHNLDSYYAYNNQSLSELFKGSEARRIDLHDIDSTLNRIQDHTGPSENLPSPFFPGRAFRAQMIQHFTNHEIHSLNGLMPELEVDYLNESNLSTRVTRVPDDHTLGAFIVYAKDGKRYVYALPAYNLEQNERRQSTASIPGCTILTDDAASYDIEGTDKSISISIVPRYAYAHLLTSVLGDNYVDFDSIPGPSEGDLGYWVKFSYTQKETDYRWRSPFSKANYEKGFQNDGYIKDDKHSVITGRKEIYYLTRVESKTHFADFKIEQRQDGRGAQSESQNSPSKDAYQWRLKEIALYSKMTTAPRVPIKVISFKHSYDLTKNTPNAASGKLTLDSLIFKYENSTRGTLSPYVFDYRKTDPLHNPNYEINAMDRWGMYRPISDICQALEFPYTSQKLTDSASVNQNAAAWHLKEITMPTGGKIKIDYEADTYGFVQNHPAMQMVKLVKSVDAGGQLNVLSNNHVRIYFELNRPIPVGPNAKPQLDKYFQTRDDIFFKIKINVKAPSQDKFEYITGYAKYVTHDLGDLNAANQYTTAWVELDLRDGYHPFRVAAWQHLRLTQPELLAHPPFDADPDASAAEEVISAIFLLDFVQAAIDLARGFNNTANSNRWAEEIEFNHSYIRLFVPNQRKIGGGSRVRKIEVNDNWADSSPEPSQAIGQVYLYDKPDGSSSGVASYEPGLGAEENPFRTAKPFREDLSFSSPYYLYSEEPSNESYFPGPTVGYSEVRVRSLIANNVIRKDSTRSIPTSGEIRYHFFTSRDYPTQLDETLMDRIPYRTFALKPLIGYSTWDNMTVTQGYSIVTNNMHGKQRKIEHYGLDNAGNIIEIPIKQITYEYTDQHDFLLAGDKKCYNKYFQDEPLKLLTGIKSHDFEAFIDVRESETKSIMSGANVNADGFIAGIIPLTIPTVWPNASRNESITRTVVLNKVMTRKYQLKKITVQESGAEVLTENLLYDAISGEQIIASINNQFGQKQYDYKSSAYWNYPGMGPAFRNLGLKINGTISSAGGNNRYQISPTGTNGAALCPLLSVLIPGDEFVMALGTSENFSVKAYLMDVTTSAFIIQTNNPLPGGSNITGNARLWLVRSGARNLLTRFTEKIISMQNPVADRKIGSCNNNPVQICNVSVTPQQTLTVNPTLFSTLSWLSNALPQSQSGSLPNTLNQRVANQAGINMVKFNANRTALNIDHQETANKKPGLIFMFSDGKGQPSSIKEFFQVTSITPHNDKIVPVMMNGNLKIPNASVKVSLKSKSGSKEYYLYSNFEELLGRPSVSLDTLEIITKLNCDSQTEPPFSIYKLDQVIDASTTTFSGNWPYNVSDIRIWDGKRLGPGNYHNLTCPYASGEMGIWRPQENFVYQINRHHSATVDLDVDGVYTDFTFFDFMRPTNACSNWISDVIVERYNPFDFEIQRKDVDDIKSAALFAYHNSLSVANSVNASFPEIGFEGFEEYKKFEKLTPATTSTGNIDFETEETTITVGVKSYDFEFQFLDERTFRVFYGSGDIDPMPPDFKQPMQWEMFGQDGTAVRFNTHAPSVIPGDNGFIIRFDPDQIPDIGIPKSGKLVLQNPRIRIPVITLKPGEVIISDDRAHTGNKSLKFQKTVDFVQYRLHLTPGKKYLLSTWFSKSISGAVTYDLQVAPDQNAGVTLSFLDNLGNPLPNPVFIPPSGPIIEAWQKVEQEFIVPPTATQLVIRLQNGSDNMPAYIDDIRVQPADASMQTFVYSPTNFRLIGLLDQNNFATMYSYDREGSLYLIRKETERGIVSLKEIHSHVKEH